MAIAAQRVPELVGLGGQTLTEIGSSGPEGAGLGFLTLKEHSPNA